jgi:hypothetical protein
MPKHLQQLEVAGMNASRKAASVSRTVTLKANIALLLVLVLVIIPTSGVALIA